MRKRARKTVVTPEDLRRETFILQNEEQVSYMMKHVFFPDAMPRVAMRSNNNDLIKSTSPGRPRSGRPAWRC